MEKLCLLLLLTLAALLHCKTSLATGVPRGPNARPRPGHCPPGRPGAAFDLHCECDEDCPRGHKCCGSFCVPAIIAVCPWYRGGLGVCADLCRVDSDCQDRTRSKCCFNGCGHECTEPYIVKPGFCGNPRGPPHCKESCTHDGDCPGKQKCCKTPCGRVCTKALVVSHPF